MIYVCSVNERCFHPFVGRAGDERRQSGERQRGGGTGAGAVRPGLAARAGRAAAGRADHQPAAGRWLATPGFIYPHYPGSASTKSNCGVVTFCGATDCNTITFCRQL